MRSVFEATDRKPVGAVIVIRGIDAIRIKVQIVGVSIVNRRRPIVAVRTHIVERAIAVVPVATGAKIITLPR